MRGHSFLIYQERITLSVQVMAGADEQKTEGRRCRLAALAWTYRSGGMLTGCVSGWIRGTRDLVCNLSLGHQIYPARS